MRKLTIGYNHLNSTYWADIKDDMDTIESATVNQTTKHNIDIWLHEHKITDVEYQNATIQY